MSVNPCECSPFHTLVRVSAVERRFKKSSSQNESGNRGLTSDGNATESQTSLHVQHIFDGMVWREYYGVRNKAIFMAFHGTDHSGLRCSRLIVVYNADAT